MNYYAGQPETEQHWTRPHRSTGFFVPAVISIIGVLAWLFYILIFALYWSKGYTLFQDIVVLIATMCITALFIGLMWIIWGRYNHAWNF